MQLLIDNFDTFGPMDYSAYLDAERLPRVTRQLNKPAQMAAQLACVAGKMLVPHQASRVWLKKADGTVLFAGYVALQPVCEYVGQSTEGAITRYVLSCETDEWILDRKALPQRLPYMQRAAGATVRQITQDASPGEFDVTAVQDCDVVPVYDADVQRKWSDHAAELAMRSRAAYSAEGGAIKFAPVGGNAFAIDETNVNCNRAGLNIAGQPGALNDVTVVGRVEPRTYVKDYFEGDGASLSFSLAATPVGIFDKTVFEDEFAGTALNPILWTNGSGSSAAVDNGVLTANGSALVELVELVEMGGGVVLQHGSFEFQGASSGVLGGLYAGGLANANCVAGFQVTPSGAQSVIQALVNGTATGPTMTTTGGHQYFLTTRVFVDQTHRMAQVFHSSGHAAGAPVGGDAIAADARAVLEIHDVDPNNPATMAAASIVLYDAVLTNVAGFCNYALMNGTALKCGVSYTRMRTNGGTCVRSAPPGQGFSTRLQGALADGGECRVTSTQLYFLAADVPAATEQIVVSYRSGRTSTAEETNAAAIAALVNASDDGVRSSVHGLKVPEARTTEDCQNSGLALLDDGTQTAWSGEYTSWSDFLGVSDVRPGDAVTVNAPSQEANFTATVRGVGIEVKDPRNDRSMYGVTFANDAAQTLSFSFDTAKVKLPPVGVTVPGNWTLAPVKNAAFSSIIASQVTIATNLAPPSGGGFEVRGTDQGWGVANDRSLWGRFTGQTFTVPRLSRSQVYYIRQYDGAGNYSRDSTLLHVDWPL
ncbi:MAG TPA: hypothetical protein VGL89_02430 [Candidatus Koribacter sp.]|jgi:hypothetical protein